MRLARVYFVCRSCREGAYPLDQRLGVVGYVSPQAKRLLCLAGASWSFDAAARRLKEFCGLGVSDNTIREVCHRQAAAMGAWQRESEEATHAFHQARGDIEFSTDGTSVNTWEGWREMRLGIFAKRARGEPATANNWDRRQLPAPHVRVAFGAIEKSDRFGARWSRWAERLGIKEPSQMSLLADGAGWIWEEAALHFPGVMGVLDIFHGLEHVADTAKKLYGEGAAEAVAWTDAGRTALLTGGWPAIRQQIVETRAKLRRAKERESLASLEGYLGKHAEHLAYAQRLAEGRSIGSGQVEGACKNLIGRRMKQTGARWRVRRANRMATLSCLVYSNQWETYWNAKNT